MSAVAAESAVLTTRRRVERAWERADEGVRRAAAAASVTGVLLALTLPSSLSVRIAAGVVGTVLVAAAVVDVHERRLPNRLLLLGGAVALAGAALTGDGATLVASSLGATIAGGSMLVVRLTRGVGMGDVKAAAVVGASAGSVALVASPIAIAVSAFVAAVYGLAAHRVRLPLGPSLWFGWAVALFGTSSGWWS
jgi:prepilin signal peptidase PulO-like enzyme (type II secretory pathway)